MSAATMSVFFFSSRRRHTRLVSDWSSDVCSSDLLQVLKLAGTLIEGRGLASLSRLTGLRELDLAGARLDDEALSHIGKLSTIERLKLSFTDITDNGFKRSEERRVGKEGSCRWER